MFTLVFTVAEIMSEYMKHQSLVRIGIVWFVKFDHRLAQSFGNWICFRLQVKVENNFLG
jgi:hypothetical protein